MPDYKKNTAVRNAPTADDATLMGNLRGQPAATPKPAAPMPGARPVPPAPSAPPAPFLGLTPEQVAGLDLTDERIGAIFAEAMSPGAKSKEHMAAILTLQQRLQQK